MLKRIENMTEFQKARFDEINKVNTLTSKAWRMRENFMGVYDCKSINSAKMYFLRWYNSVIHSNIPAMKKAAKTLREHWEGIVNNIGCSISNAKAEQLNAKIQKLQVIGHGYSNFNNFRAAILFFNGKLDLFSHGKR
jgi:transposase